MAERCPRCFAELPEDTKWVCPACGYTLRTPGVGKAGLFFMFLALVLVVAYVVGPESLGLTNGMIPTDLATFLIANFPLTILGTFGLGVLLTAAGAAAIRHARDRTVTA